MKVKSKCQCRLFSIFQCRLTAKANKFTFAFGKDVTCNVYIDFIIIYDDKANLISKHQKKDRKGEWSIDIMHYILGGNDYTIDEVSKNQLDYTAELFGQKGNLIYYQCEMRLNQ